MKRRIWTLLLLLLVGATFAKAQMIAGKEPVGTVFTFDIKISGGMAGSQSFTTTQTLTAKEGNLYTFLVKTVVPAPSEMTVTTRVEEGMMVQALEDAIEQMKAELKASGMGDTQIEVSGDLYRVPLEGKVGDKFAGATYTAKAQLPMGPYSMKYSVSDIEVVSVGTVDLPAGSFDGMLLSLPTDIEISFMGQTQKMHMDTKLWVNKEYGVVQQTQSSTVSGTITSTLASIKRP